MSSKLRCNFHWWIMILQAISFVLALTSTVNATPSQSESGSLVYSLNNEDLTAEEFNELLVNNLRKKELVWPGSSDGNVNIPYRIESSTVNKNFFTTAIRKWEVGTCLKFKELSVVDKNPPAYLKVVTTPRGCSAYLGYVPNRVSIVSMSQACGYRGYLHELGHALGFIHEQCRTERDLYVIVKKENVRDGAYPLNFGIQPSVNFDIPYDYTSVMHYHAWGQRKNNKRTLLTTDARFLYIIGQYDGPSFFDTKLVNKAYGCDKQWLKKCGEEHDLCMNEGYLGSDCKCRCPLGTSGEHCEHFAMSYHDAVLKKLAPKSSIITKTGTVTSPGYPVGVKDPIKYTQVIRAPHCQRVVLKFEDFNMLYRNKNWHNLCSWDFLEIRTSVDQAMGQYFCGKDIAKGRVFKSEDNELILHVKNYDYRKWAKNPYQGYKATFSTEPIPNCV